MRETYLNAQVVRKLKILEEKNAVRLALNKTIMEKVSQ